MSHAAIVYAMGECVKVTLPEEDAMHGWSGSVGRIVKTEAALYKVEGTGFTLWADASQLEHSDGTHWKLERTNPAPTPEQNGAPQ